MDFNLPPDAIVTWEQEMLYSRDSDMGKGSANYRSIMEVFLFVIKRLLRSRAAGCRAARAKTSLHLFISDRNASTFFHFLVIEFPET